MTNEELIALASIINNTFDGHIANAIVIPEQNGTDSMFTLTIAGESVTFDSKLNVQVPKEMKRIGSTCGTIPGTAARFINYSIGPVYNISEPSITIKK